MQTGARSDTTIPAVSSHWALLHTSLTMSNFARTGSEQRLAQTDGYEPQRSNVLKMLGYYSLLGLLRVHSLIGDYHGGLAALAPLNPFKRKNLLTQRIAGVACSVDSVWA